jgi:hypothetical protein
MLLTVYVIVAVPAATPVTIPVPLPTLATPVLPLVQVPPLEKVAPDAVRVTVAVGHTVDVPLMVPAVGNGLIVTAAVAVAVPQLLVTE